MTTPTPRWERALVTGASSGIGEAMARQLAADGTRLVLVARRGDRLAQLAAELHGDVEVLVADLGTDEGRAATVARLRDESSPIDLLVANAGISALEKVHSGSWERARSMIELNVLGVAELVYAIAPLLVARGGGGILVTSSTASFQPVAGSATYGASKAFATSFVEAIHEELRGTGVHATAVCPGPTDTEILGPESVDAVPKLLVTTPEGVAAEALAGVAAGRCLVIPGLPNRVGAVASTLAPRRVTRRVAGALFNRYATEPPPEA